MTMIHSPKEEKTDGVTQAPFQIMQAYTVAMQSIVSLPTCMQHRPSVLVSQNAVAAVCMGEPFFCMMTHVTTYLKGFCCFASSFRQSSMICDVQPDTLSLVYVWLLRALWIACLAISWTCSVTNSFSP